MATQVDETRREAALLRGAEYLERYYVLISFGAYVQSPDFVIGLSSFETWIHARPELQSILKCAASACFPLLQPASCRSVWQPPARATLQRRIFPGPRTDRCAPGSDRRRMLWRNPMMALAAPTLLGTSAEVPATAEHNEARCLAGCVPLACLLRLLLTVCAHRPVHARGRFAHPD